jgi:hypothetical protein
MINDEIKDYAKIAGVSVLSILKYSIVGIAINWIYGLVKVGWYIDLFQAGGWYIALAIFIILLLFAGIPALYIYFGYKNGFGIAISKAIQKNQGFLTGLLHKMAYTKTGQKFIENSGNITASAGEHRVLRFIIKLSGYKSDWEKLSKISKNSTPEELETAIEQLINKIVTVITAKITAGLTSNLRNIVIANLILGIVIEVLSHLYPIVAAAAVSV